MRRRNKPTREKESLTMSGAQALAAGAAIAAGTQAYAAPIRFDNPDHGGAGHFHWPEEWLDIAVGASDQIPGRGTGGKFLQRYQYYNYPYPGPSLVLGYYGTTQVQTFGFYSLGPVLPGETIPNPSTYFKGYGFIQLYYSTYLPEHEDTYIASRINLDGQWHYGWMGVRRDAGILEAFAWGYETEPGVPIAAGAVPEPGTLAMLALGFVGVAITQRRRNG